MPGDSFGLYLIAHGIGLGLIILMIIYQHRRGKDD